MNGEDNIACSFCRWSACRMYTEMSYRTKLTHSGQDPAISQFTPSEIQHIKYRNAEHRASLLN